MLVLSETIVKLVEYKGAELKLGVTNYDYAWAPNQGKQMVTKMYML